MAYRYILFGTVLSLASFHGDCQSVKPTELGKFEVKHPAFLSLFEDYPGNPDPKSRYTLLIATFDALPFSTDSVEAVRKIGTHMDNVPGTTAQSMTSKVTWPNDISGVPDSILGGPGAVVIPDGFTEPFKRKGSISVLNITANPPEGPYQISGENKTEWFYNKVIWKDMDGDGRMDALTCRVAHKADGQLIWFKNPGPPFFQSPWEAYVLAPGPDVYLTPATLPSPDGDLDTILIPGYYFRRLSVYWIEGNNTWANPDLVKSRVIEDYIDDGPVFDVQAADVNGDGKTDLLVTISKREGGRVVVYELPEDFRTGNFTKHVIASDFKSRGIGEDRSAPGSASIFFPTTGNGTNSRPSILVSGDDDGRAYVLTPSSADPTNWQYQLTPFLDVGAETVGSVAYADVDGDGFLDLFVPAYNSGEIYVYTFKPAN